MHPICDAVAVLGSRHGLIINPSERRVSMLRFDRFAEQKRFGLRAGLRIGGREFVLPLGPGGEDFTFLDQQATPCSVVLTGMCALAGLRVRLTLVHPFRPRDGDFSTTPVIGLRLDASRIPGQFRWSPPSIAADEAELFLEVVDAADPGLLREATPAVIAPYGADAVDLSFDSSRTPWKPLTPAKPGDAPGVFARQHDRLLAPGAQRVGTTFVQRFTVATGGRLDAAWCTWTADGLCINGVNRSPDYTRRFASLDAVADWARHRLPELFANAARVDGLIAANDAGVAVNRLLAQTLHAWLVNTWWMVDWFSVWEGNCYFHSTVDVEYTQAPFYLCLWPELLALEIDQWTRFAKDGAGCLGPVGAGTAFLSHDYGGTLDVDRQSYPHDMEVEETANWIILLVLHWRRTGDDTLLRRHPATLRRFLAFLVAASDADGVPERGVANTIDDGAPAVQFGRKQTYLAAKALGAWTAAGLALAHLGETVAAADATTRAQRLRVVIERNAWQGDHYAVLIEKGGEIINPWTKARENLAAIPGWDAAHIYTPNTQALFDLIGLDLGLDPAHVAQDLAVAARRCLHRYGCSHSDYVPEVIGPAQAGLAGASTAPGWVSMNMLRDLAALYRGVDLRDLPNRYWEWQTTANSQEEKLFFETFHGNDLHYYPRGVAVWGWFDALAGRSLDRVAGQRRERPAWPGLRAPDLLAQSWS